MTLTVGSLFSGIGGLDLGLERAGMNVIWQSEIDPYACKVLAKHWPEVPNHGNIKEIDWGRVIQPDVICGGYPCQPFSTAGKRRGEDDPRHLWPWVRQAISQLRPRYAILENVRGHLSLGGTTVIGELAEIGYDAEWRVVSAASVGANHRRDRVIIVAYPDSERRMDSGYAEQPNQGRLKAQRDIGQSSANVAYPNDDGSSPAAVGGSVAKATGKPQTGTNNSANAKRRGGVSNYVANPDLRQIGWGHRRDATDRSEVFGWGNYSRGTQGYEGGQWWQIEPDVGRVADGIPNRVDRLRGLGNAVVPQVAEVIGRLVMAHAHN